MRAKHSRALTRADYRSATVPQLCRRLHWVPDRHLRDGACPSSFGRYRRDRERGAWERQRGSVR